MNQYMLRLKDKISLIKKKQNINQKDQKGDEVRYIKVSFFSVVISLPFLVWAVFFTSSSQFINLTPQAQSYKSISSPLLGVSWIKIPFVKAARARLSIDGKEVSGVMLNKRGFQYKPGYLKDGIHTAQAIVGYNFPYPKSIILSWKFTVDTKPPDLDIEFLSGANVRNGIVAVPSVNFFVKGKTEHHARVSFRASPTLKSIETKGNGKFAAELPVEKGNMNLKIISRDLAGNITRKNYKVIEDKEAPKIVSSPKNDETFRGFPTMFAIKASDPESWISSSRLKLTNGFTASFSTDDSKSFTGELKLGDGFYKGQIEVSDAVGHNTVLPVSFKVDSLRLVVVRSERKLYVYKQGKVVKVYRVAVGMPRYPTPRGHFKIVNKRSNPKWVNPGSGWAKSMPSSIPPGPDNPLGTRAMDLSVSGIRIHGTPNSGSIGTAASHGCIRMYKWESEQLFRIVSIGTPVDIQ